MEEIDNSNRNISHGMLVCMFERVFISHPSSFIHNFILKGLIKGA
jgi:hypothetical protein